MRALVWFWAGLILASAIGAGVLQWRGAPATHEAAAHAAAPAAEGKGKGKEEKPATEPAGPPPLHVIPPPDLALEEASPDFAGGLLPKVGDDHRTPMDVYAAASDAADTHPKVAILLGGLGMSASDSQAAVEGTPAAVSLAVSPYAVAPLPLLEMIRQHGHEYFLAIPMEPANYPLDDPGNRALLTGNSPGLNEQNLGWAMTRFGGYVGATGALGALHGERFSDSPTQMGPVLTELSHRGVIYVDPRPGGGMVDGAVGRAVDAVIDGSPGAADIDAALAKLEETAMRRGSALGLVSLPRPVALARLAAWAEGLAHRGLTLAPVSAVARSTPRTQQAAP